MSRTNIELNDELVEEAQRLTGAKTKREVVEIALRELLRMKRKPKKDLADLAGKIEFHDGFDYKALRGDREFPD